jgi:uroporphyrinogen III methyltransferase/synthase
MTPQAGSSRVAPPTPPPLGGRRIVVTRAREQAGDLVRALEALGAEVVPTPMIRIEPVADLEPLRRALADLPRYRWIVFTSQNTVQVVCDQLPAWGHSPRVFRRTSVAAIGPATADALTRQGISVVVLPDDYVAESLVAAIAAHEASDLVGARVLLPQAATARDTLAEGLRALGAVVDVVPVYRTTPALGDGTALAAEILGGRIDVITFTSSSTVHHFVTAVGDAAVRSGRFSTAVIGPITAETARSYGIVVAIEAAEHTTTGLVNALVRHFA